MFSLGVVTHGEPNRVGGIPPINNNMCVTRSKEKIGKYAPVRIYTRVHYYKREISCRQIERKMLQYGRDREVRRVNRDGVNNDCVKLGCFLIVRLMCAKIVQRNETTKYSDK